MRISHSLMRGLGKFTVTQTKNAVIHFTLRQLQENTTVCANLLGSVFVIRNTLVELSSVTLSDKTQGGGPIYQI